MTPGDTVHGYLLERSRRRYAIDPEISVTRFTSGLSLLKEIGRSRDSADFVVLEETNDARPLAGFVRRLQAHCPGIPLFVQSEVMTRGTSARLYRAGVSGLIRGAHLRLADLKGIRTNGEETGTPGPPSFRSFLTENADMRRVLTQAAEAARGSHPVLITGETGTGKDLLARLIHTASGRSGAMITENVAGLNDDLFSDTLFGHCRGAFTGARRDRVGLVRRARGGTLFLDEIGDLSSRSQVKLLRLLERGEFYPLGSSDPECCDVRFVVATNRELFRLVQEEEFRADLFYRLSFNAIHLPPLRDRREDIPLLAMRFVRDAARIVGKPTPTVPEETMELLLEGEYPGNVRELRSRITNAVVVCPGTVLLPEYFLDPCSLFPVDAHPMRSVVESRNAEDVFFAGELPNMAFLNQLLVEEALRRAGGNQSLAAQLIGISPSAVNKRLRRSELELPSVNTGIAHPGRMQPHDGL